MFFSLIFLFADNFTFVMIDTKLAAFLTVKHAVFTATVTVQTTDHVLNVFNFTNTVIT